MHAGVAEVRGTFWGFVFYGWSHQHLWFQPVGGDKRMKIVGSGEASAAHRCEACGAVAIPPPKPFAEQFAERMKGAAKQVANYMEERKQPPRQDPRAP